MVVIYSLSTIVKRWRIVRLEQYTQPFVSPFYQAYLEEPASLSSFFHYEWNQDAFNKRLNEANFDSYKREELVTVIRKYMEPFGLSEKSNIHLEELRDNGVVVIGGQQAGLLTGPMYSIHKAISVITLAKQQREKLGIPVIPVFWIAGEDHDIDEINHVYIERSKKLQKAVYPEKSRLKKIASETLLDREVMELYLDEIFRSLPETIYTKSLYKKLKAATDQYTTYTEFFTALMNDFFNQEGLLMVDAAYKPLRQLEREFFQKLVDNSSEISNVVFTQEQLMKEAGYGTPIEAKQNAANLFYVLEGERFLLEKQGPNYVNEQKGISLTSEELTRLIQDSPERLSNNVVTRPLMQEMVFPVLSFIGGPGEIAYWATLKPAFELLGMKMPVITPRLSVTVINTKLQSLLDRLSFTIQDVWSGVVAESKSHLIAENKNEEISAYIEGIHAELEGKYQQLEELLKGNNLKLSPLVEKNLEYHKSQLDFLNRAIDDTVLGKLDSALSRYDRLIMELVPNGGLQERTYCPIQLLNEQGTGIIEQLLNVPYEFSGKHHVVYL